MKKVQQRLEQALQKRREEGNERSLLPDMSKDATIDLTSNDYLGLANSVRHVQNIVKNFQDFSLKSGSSGSRLLSGNSDFIEKTEREIASFHGFEAGLFFTAGYAANLGLLSSVPSRHDHILYDEKCHASIKEGVRLGSAKTHSFRHNDLTDLKKKMQGVEGSCYVVCESIYSMDGDQAPLRELVDLCTANQAALIVDEAHALGVCGEKGEGLVASMGLQKDVFACVYAFGKAAGAQGGFVAGSKTLRNYLLNFCKAFIYTTAPSPFQLISVTEAYQRFPHMQKEREHIQKLRDRLRDALAGVNHVQFIAGEAAIQIIQISGNAKTRAIAAFLREKGWDVRPILSPTVPEGGERIRICLHAFNQLEEMDRFAEDVLASANVKF